MPQHLQVLFDGTDNAPMGRYLVAEPEVRRAAPPLTQALHGSWSWRARSIVHAKQAERDEQFYARRGER